MHKDYINYVYDIHNGIVTKLLNKNMNTKTCIAIRARAGAGTFILMFETVAFLN